jgi:hypothetical protein
LKGKVQRISVLEKDFVGMVSSCNVASVSDCDLVMILVTMYMEYLCNLFPFCYIIYAEKLCFLGDKITSYQLELRNRARIIYELKEQLDAEKINNKFHPQLEEISIY